MGPGLSHEATSPVRDGDTVTVCGSRWKLAAPDVITVSSFTRHWLQMHDPRIT